MEDLIIEAPAQARTGLARFGALAVRCALGRGGIAATKVEGDGCTPVGSFPLRRLLYRPDRVRGLVAHIPTLPISPSDGWCDDPRDPAYNRPVTRPYAASHEALWRDDALYDLVLVIGHNDAPVVPGGGSAVFLHVARYDYGPTEGCVAFARSDLLALLHKIQPSTQVVIRQEGALQP